MRADQSDNHLVGWEAERGDNEEDGAIERVRERQMQVVC